ncbi:F-box/kelch-repeat protein At1g57790-like [Chenopodium quinoa]|uniref:F-box/kelch-repeat protein At1g57790-like n=1 Tax=Chenopodium quinoa TaxID=63459 RepID=UPI000B76F417|nr:F-box/kelch-repeat protein At1g57790-like [Chenopodium quinoa]
MRDWGDMPKEIVTKIVEHVEFYEDFETLQKICSHWRLAAKATKFRAYLKESCSGDEHTLPWLMLPGKNDFSTILRLYSVSKKMVYHINLPLHNIRKDPKKLLSSLGWLLVLSNTTGEGSLLNPYTNAIIKLPKIYSFYIGALRFKFTLSANPLTTSDFIVFLYFYDLLVNFDTPHSKLFYWKNGDVMWVRVTNPYPNVLNVHEIGRFLNSTCVDVTFYEGEFYGTNRYGWIVKFETAQGSPHFRVVANLSCQRHVQAKKPNSSTTVFSDTCFYYLVKSLGQLLIIRQVKWFDILRGNLKIGAVALQDLRYLS